VTFGFRDAAALENNPALLPLQGRDDFKDLLRQLQAKPK
jgi:hypothetical protein